MKKLLSCILAAVCALSLFAVTACNRKPTMSNGEELDPNRVQLYVGNLYGGYGDGWLYEVKERFEKAYADYEFPNGKTGVQVWINSDRDKYFGTTMMNTVGGMTDEVFFSESVYYYDWVARDLVLDITDVVTEPLSAYGETRSIEDKMSDQQTDYFGIEDGGEKHYYMLPFYEAYNGLSYDIDLFEEELLYFADTVSDGTRDFVSSLSDKRSAGPDGIYCEVCAANGYDYGKHTCDDGLPATYEEFFQLCDYMQVYGITPVIYAGMFQEYINKFLPALAADHDGYENTVISYTFDGTIDNYVTGFDGDGNPIERTKEITSRNGYEVFNTSGAYYALSFYERLIRGGYFDSRSFNDAYTQTMSEEAYLRSKKDNKPIAMIIDGSWWNNEASEIFVNMVQESNNEAYSQENRRFGFLPYPKVSAEKAGAPVLMDFNYSACFIRKGIAEEKVDIAKKFLQFCHTDESLAAFTMETSTTKPYDYDMSEEQLSSMTEYGRGLYNLHTTGTVVFPYSDNEIWRSAVAMLDMTKRYEAELNGITYPKPATVFKNQTDMTARTYFGGIVAKYDADWWESTFKNYFG